MKDISHIIIPLLILVPFSAGARVFDKPSDRDLTLEEKKLGSVYRGCIGFHCLEREPFLEVELGVSDISCHGKESSGEEDVNYACLTFGTNAREGVVVLLETEFAEEVCLEEMKGGMRAMNSFKEGCGDVRGQAVVMRTDDLAEAAFGRLVFSEQGPPGKATIMSVIAY